MKYIITTNPFLFYKFCPNVYKLIFIPPNIQKEIKILYRNGLTDYLINICQYAKINKDYTLYDIFIQEQNELYQITDATHFLLVNCTVIINNEVIQHCKKNNISLLNIHPGYIDNIGRFPLIKSLKTNNYGVFCHEVSNIIDDTRNVLYKYNIETQNNKAGLDFMKTKTEYIISQIGRLK
jgi:hypothetical protein